MVVLGVNTSDDEEIVRQYLEENGVSFPNILDTSPAAWQAMAAYETLGMTAVPMTYVIDRQGKIVTSWYGFDEARMDRALEKLGLDSSEE